MTYKEVKTLAPVDAAYLAGLIDGEGTVTLSRRNRNKYRGLVVSISNTEMAILKHVEETVGAGKITNKMITSANHSPSYTFNISNRQALALLQQIAPFMKSHKSIRASLVLEQYLRLTPRNGRYTNEQLQERRAFVQKFFSIRASYHTGRLGRLNEQGVEEERVESKLEKFRAR